MEVAYSWDEASGLAKVSIRQVQEVNANVLENFDVQASVAYTDAIFSDWPDAPCYANQTPQQGCVNGVQDLSGAEMPRA